MVNTADAESPVDRRYESIDTADGDLVIYDHDQPTAWLQSDRAAEIRQ